MSRRVNTTMFGEGTLEVMDTGRVEEIDWDMGGRV
jgi:hypothetical protein